MMSSDLAKLLEAFPNLNFLQHELLAPHTYMKTGGPAEMYVRVADKESFAKLVHYCIGHDIYFIVLGGASNVLIMDEGLSGLVIQNATKALFVDKGTTRPKTVILETDSGVPTSLVVRKAIDEGLQGLEMFLGVPGTIGGAIYNNSHYMTELIGMHILEVEVIERKSNVRKWIPHHALQFAYDFSVFHNTNDIILTVRFRLEKGNKLELKKRALEATRKRASTQPLGLPSSGCMFRNEILPDGSIIHAGELIEKAGLKGIRLGDAMVSEKHANFIVNVGHATASEVYNLSERVREVVKSKFGVVLQREVFVLQNFSKRKD